MKLPIHLTVKCIDQEYRNVHYPRKKSSLYLKKKDIYSGCNNEQGRYIQGRSQEQYPQTFLYPVNNNVMFVHTSWNWIIYIFGQSRLLLWQTRIFCSIGCCGVIVYFIDKKTIQVLNMDMLE